MNESRSQLPTDGKYTLYDIRLPIDLQEGFKQWLQ